MDEMTVKCPACGEDLKLEMANPADESQDKSMPSMDEAATMPLEKLREKLPKKAE